MQQAHETKTSQQNPKPNPRRSALHSKMAVDRKKSVADLAASLTVQSATVSTSLVKRLEPVLEPGEEMPDVKLLIELLGRLVERSGDELDAVDDSRFFAALDLRALRHTIAESKSELHAAAVAVRKILVDLFGAARCRFQFGFSERTPRGAADLAIETRRLVGRLSDPRLALPEPEVPGMAVDPEGWVGWLTPALERLEAALAELDQRKIAAEDTVIARQRALTACDETYLQVARTAEALFTLAGETELAQRLRPKARRRKRNPAVARMLQPLAHAQTAAMAFLKWLRAALARLAPIGPGWRLRKPNWRQPAVWRLARGSSKTPIL